MCQEEDSGLEDEESTNVYPTFTQKAKDNQAEKYSSYHDELEYSEPQHQTKDQETVQLRKKYEDIKNIKNKWKKDLYPDNDEEERIEQHEEQINERMSKIKQEIYEK